MVMPLNTQPRMAPGHGFHSVITSYSFSRMLHEVVGTQTQTPSITCCWLRKSMTRDGYSPIFNNIYYHKILAHQQKCNFSWRSLYEIGHVTWLFRCELLNLLILPKCLLLSLLLLPLLLSSLPFGHFIGIICSFHTRKRGDNTFDETQTNVFITI